MRLLIPIDEEKKKHVQQAMKNINKDYGDNAVGFYSELDNIDIKKFSTGLISVDVALGGGLPRGDFSEIAGKPSVGKTTLCLGIISVLQKQGEICAFIDVEKAFGPEWARKNGVILDGLIISQPDTLEQALTIVEGLVKSGGVSFIVVDSLAALTPEEVVKRPLSKDTVGLRARKMAQFFDKNNHFVKRSGAHVMFTNQWRDNPNPFAGAETPGGWSAKHNFAIRMNIWRGNSDIVTVGDEPIASKSNIEVRKNKVGAPYRKADFRIDFDTGINYEFDLVSFAIQMGVVDKSGAWYSYGGKTVAQGENNLIELLRVDRELFGKIDRDVREILGLLEGREEDDGDE